MAGLHRTFLGYNSDGVAIYRDAMGRIVDEKGNDIKNSTVFSTKPPEAGNDATGAGEKATTSAGNRTPVFSGGRGDSGDSNYQPRTGLVNGVPLNRESLRLIRISQAKNAIIEHLFGSYAEFEKLRKAGDPSANVDWDKYGLGKDGNAPGFTPRTAEAGKAFIEQYEKRKADEAAEAAKKAARNASPQGFPEQKGPPGIYGGETDEEGKFTPSQETIDLLKSMGVDTDKVDWNEFGKDPSQLPKQWEGDLVPTVKVVNGQKVYSYGNETITEDQYNDLLAAQNAAETGTGRPDMFTDALERQEDGSFKLRNPYSGALERAHDPVTNKMIYKYNGQVIGANEYNKIAALQANYKDLYAARPGDEAGIGAQMGWEYRRREALKKLNDYYKSQGMSTTEPAAGAPAAASNTAAPAAAADTAAAPAAAAATAAPAAATTGTTPIVTTQNQATPAVAAVQGMAGIQGTPKVATGNKGRRPNVFAQNQQTQLESNKLGFNGNHNLLPFGG